jgi:hypothetical protein
LLVFTPDDLSKMGRTVFITQKKLPVILRCIPTYALAELETEIYRWMKILSSTHGLEISMRFNAGLQLTPLVMFYTEL